MKEKKENTRSESDFNRFLEYRKGLLPLDRKLEAAQVMDQIHRVDVNRGFQQVHERINQPKKRQLFFSALTRIAAVLTIPLLAFTIWSIFYQNEENGGEEFAQNSITWQEIQSPVGMRSHVVLPDGTNLWLNAGSRLRYSIPFAREKREVELTGEAYLDVVRNEQSPFIVKTGISRIEVLGTAFNVNAYPESGQIKVALKEGSVKFLFAADGETTKFCELEPNDLMVFDKKEQTVTLDNTNIEKHIAWHRNVMILDDTPMTQLARMLEQWYGVKVVVANEEIKQYRFTTTFDNEPLHRVLELLEISSPRIAIHYNPGKPINDSKTYSPSVVTITKK